MSNANASPPWFIVRSSGEPWDDHDDKAFTEWHAMSIALNRASVGCTLIEIERHNTVNGQDVGETVFRWRKGVGTVPLLNSFLSV